jgi:polyisoprenoid-binding protein YceI
MSNMSTIAAGTPTGIWRIDPAHSSVSFRSGT